MDARRGSESTPMKNRTTVERRSDRELVLTRTFNGPARLVFEAWTKPELLKRWWVPKSTGISLLSCEADVRVGGAYRFEFGRDGSKLTAFFGRYLEVVPHSRLVWTNEESDDGAVTTVTFEERAGKTLVVWHDLYPSKEALDAAIGMEGGMTELFEQLDELLVTLGASLSRPEGRKVTAPELRWLLLEQSLDHEQIVQSLREAVREYAGAARRPHAGDPLDACRIQRRQLLQWGSRSGRDVDALHFGGECSALEHVETGSVLGESDRACARVHVGDGSRRAARNGKDHHLALGSDGRHGLSIG
jgi:uncharacterized protein YndB with AHSA1/START domain